MDISLSPIENLDVDLLTSSQHIDISLTEANDMLDYSLDHIEDLEISGLDESESLDVDLNSGILVRGSVVVVNPPDSPTDSMETIKVDGQTYDIFEKDPTVPPWAKTPSKPSYTAEEVGAVDIDNELPYAEIDRMFAAVFGI